MQNPRLTFALLMFAALTLAAYLIADYTSYQRERDEKSIELGKRAGNRVAKTNVIASVNFRKPINKKNFQSRAFCDLNVTSFSISKGCRIYRPQTPKILQSFIIWFVFTSRSGNTSTMANKLTLELVVISK